MDMLRWGADFLHDQAKTHASQLVEVSWKENDVLKQESMQASLVDEEGHIVREEVKLKTEHTFFMFATSDLVSKSVPLKRGLRIQWGNEFFEAVIRGSKCYFFNDAFQFNTVIATKHVPQ